MKHVRQLAFIQLRQILSQANLTINHHPLLTKLLWLTLLSLAMCYSGGYTYLLCQVLDGAIILSLFYALISFILMCSTLYFVHDLFILCQDHAILYPLPIKKRTIIQSKFLAIYLLNFILCLVIMIPVHLILLYHNQNIWIAILLYPFLPILPISMGLILGYLIANISSKFKHRQFLTIALTFIFIISLFAITHNLNNNIDLSSFTSMLLEMFKHLYYPTILYYNVMYNLDVISLLALLALHVIAYYAFIYIASQFQATTFNQTYSLKKTSSHFSLFRLELNRYFHSVGYVTNTAVGYVLLFLGFFFMHHVPQSFLPFIYLFLIGMSTTTHVSFSLEGHYFWIKKTLPIPFIKLAKAKLMVTYILSIPSLIISSLVYSYFYGFSLQTIVLCTLGTLLFPLLGLSINLFCYNFAHTNDTIVVKQSLSSLIMLSAVALLSGLPLFASFYYDKVPLITMLIYLMMTIISSYIIIKKGPLQYAKMPDSGH